MKSENNTPLVTIFSDGACRGNPGPGGWAALLRYNGHEKLLSGAASHTTNNRMELRAAVNALRSLKHPCRVDFYTDSRYLQQGITRWLANWQANGWRTTNKKPVKNRDLWQELAAALQQHNVRWHWVKGHAGHPENELVDQAARAALDEEARHAAPDMETLPDDFH